jgi:dynein heavy chain
LLIRFYFISNDDLIEILSQAKDFDKVQGHLNKLFDAIKRVVIDPAGNIVAMESPEGEVVMFEDSWLYNPSDAITDQLNKIETNMYDTIHQKIKQAIKNIKENSDHRIDWMMGKHCAQAIVTADSFIWSTSTESCFVEMDEAEDELDHLIDMLEKDLKDVIEKVRKPLAKNKRRMINSLITQDVHYRDITEMLYTENVSNRDDFRWQQQLRFYQHGPKSDLIGRQVNIDLNYGNEYLGVASKLAITPLTDRCWMTITGALYLHLGCAPVGPAGTGKTESTKDLAKNLGTYCIVYNCSEQVTVSMMSTQFMGVMMTGAWLCLDEFNRIDIEVLSVIAQQILSMKNALSLNSKNAGEGEGSNTFFFDGQPVAFGDVSKFTNLTIFTTMNPGYAGRTELPDNLKVLFRSVSMMVPDYALIAEILLYSEGFFNAKDLAIKLTKLYKLASEQLSQQQHYDFGMRAVKSILSMAGSLKRNNPEEDEDLLLIEAMKDTNIPKFLDVDIKLFEAIVQDLFPKKIHHKKLNQTFLDELHKSVAEYHLQPVPKFIEKCCQFDDIMKIRFGNMLLGPPMTGKTSVLNCLRLTYQKLFDNSAGDEYLPVDCMVLNPKSITMGELYGQTDPKTGDFSNGLASKIFADFASREKKETKWIVFDGPVDSLWIESLNSVLDDSMTLCLSNGKRIKLKLDMRVLFEVQDLAQASPATVSRIGMVYLDGDTLFHIDMLKTIFETEFKRVNIPESHKEGYISRADMFFDKLLIYLRKNCKEPLKTINNNLVYSFCRIIKSFYELGEFTNRFVSDDEEEDKKIEQIMIGKVFIFATAWSLMTTIDEQTSGKMDQLASNLFNINELPRGSLLDCFLDLSEKEHHWIKWDSLSQEFEYNPTMKWSEILVPTINTKRFSYILRRAIQCKYPIYFSGITGTGKTVICQNVISEMNEKGLITPLQFTFSAKTSSLQIQTQMTSKMNILRRERRTSFGIEKVSCLVPKYTPKSLVVHIDDINMPEVELYGAQPPIELLRQTIDQKGFYDRQFLEWREVEDTVFVATSVPPGNGRLPLTDRFMRHFHILNIQASNEEIMKSIFGKVIKNFFESFDFKAKIKGMDENLVIGTLQLYREMVTKMLPTPTKSHYTFNLRDVSKVFQGLVKMRPQKFSEPEMVAKLWIHECTRVFGDRLVTKKDREFFATTLSSLTGHYGGLSCTPQEIIDDKFLFGDFLNSATRELEYLDKLDKVMKSIMIYMENTKVRIELFKDSIRHLCRLNRILRQVGGHGLLIGVGGSGKKSLVTVASEMAQTIIKQIEPTKDYDIRAFRKEVYLNMLSPAGHEGKEITFLLTDTHIVSESFLEEVNNLINTGEIVLEREEMDKLRKGSEAEMAKLRINEDPVEFFVKRVKDKLHIVLAMSPIGDTLRTRVRNFPSFVNCCTIDWLDPWPVDALMTVSKKMLEDTFKGQTIDQDTANKICNSCVETHLATIESASEFLLILKRKVYITPKTYIDLLKAFKSVLKELKGSIEENINKLTNGLSKLIESGEKVEYYKEEIARMQPVLAKKNIEVQELIEKLTVEKEVVDKQAVEVEKEKIQVQAKAEQINEIKKDAEAEYQKAKPILDLAIKALDVLTRNDLAELKMGKLSSPKKDILECMMIFLGESMDEKSIQKTLTSAGLIDQLRKVEPRHLTRDMAKQVNVKLTSANLTEKGLAQVNAALVSLFKWLKGLIQAQESDEIVRKMEAKAEDITKVYNVQMEALKKKQEELDGVLRKLQQLQDAYDGSNREKTKLDAELIKTNTMLENSGKLTVGLAEEHVRWVATVKDLEKSRSYILGDAFLSAACLAYHGPFTGIYRQNLIESWYKILQKNDLKFSSKYAFENVMGDISVIRKWNLQGLPSNKISVCNGVLVKRASSFPFMIDPQLQANKWIKNMEANTSEPEQSLRIVKANDSKNLSRTLEACIMNNIPCLIEDADEAINPYLDPLLLKQNDENKGGKALVKLGTGDEVVVEPDFRLYFTTKISNPNFLPELFIRVSIINFTVTEDGLEEQLLAEVVRVVMKEIEDKRIELVVSIAEGKNKLRQNEDDILKSLKNSQGNILENTPLVQNLENSKKQSEEIKLTLEENEIAQVKINAAREQFRPVAIRGGLLYFIICDLSDIDPMYQFSLSYVTKLFVNTIISCKNQKDKPDNHKDLGALFVERITENIYLNVCRGLFNDHKKIFAFLLASKIQKRVGNIKNPEWDLFLKGIPLGASFKTFKMPPAVQIDEKSWERFFYFASFSDPAREFLESMNKDTGLLSQVDQWARGEEPLKTTLPRDYDHKLSLFQKFLVLQCLKPDSVLSSMIDYVGLFHPRWNSYWARSSSPTKHPSSVKSSRTVTRQHP